MAVGPPASPQEALQRCPSPLCPCSQGSRHCDRGPWGPPRGKARGGTKPARPEERLRGDRPSAQRGRREPAYPASSSDRKLKLFKRLPLDSDTALVSGEVMGMSQERAGVAVEAPGGGCFPPGAPRSSGRGGPWSLQAVGLQSRLRVPSPSAGSRGDTRLSPADTETRVPVGWPRTTALQPGPAPPGAWF